MDILNSNYGYPKFKTILDIHLDKTFKDILKQADFKDIHYSNYGYH